MTASCETTSDISDREHVYNNLWLFYDDRAEIVGDRVILYIFESVRDLEISSSIISPQDVLFFSVGGICVFCLVQYFIHHP